MGRTNPPKPVKLIVGMLTQDESLFTEARRQMETLWGPVDIESEVMDFSQTNYYEKEMGGPLLRRFVSFAQLIDPGDLAQIKHQSNELEDRFSRSDIAHTLAVTRPINLDPGYVDPGKLVLATTKNYSHRIYIGQQMYAEATLHYHRGQWQSWPYTYPDYAEEHYHKFLTAARQKLMDTVSRL
ncbi:MAG: DUF4416 family protein [Sedimentisphaerales bacterium]|nr:DUF4416 family protein [Sedimentisphaerales bacterium]